MPYPFAYTFPLHKGVRGAAPKNFFTISHCTILLRCTYRVVVGGAQHPARLSRHKVAIVCGLGVHVATRGLHRLAKQSGQICGGC